ncbi:copper-containing nitrite reductase [uncultured Cytophaga sp.]|uniref:copper-containing nitrite reductase n=1 Tax=uncultured Cytophaga sp. TaxID=160238 RepID=UPI00261AF8FB|nr:copper-containing nitrite reductase [uncultured Cytophaga sp.]
MNRIKQSTRTLGTLLLMGSSLFFMSSCSNSANQDTTTVANKTIETIGQENAEMTSPPLVPKAIGDRAARKLNVDLEIIEKEGEMLNGVKYVYWTFGGTVPGSFIRARIGDEIEVTLKNHPDNKLPHNIDMHAVTGPGGGAASSFVAPGHTIRFSFKALNVGLFVYHCATAPVGMHIANGMYGLILIEPEGGLPPVDKEYYIMQGDFYTKGKHGQPGLQPFDMQKAMDEHAEYVVFNGKVGALSGDNAITAAVGETVRLYVGNGGPNLVSSFHVIGEIFDRVHVEGGSLVNENVQTTLIPAGGATMIEFKVEVPGDYAIVDHSIFRAFNKGALGTLKVTGMENHTIYSGKKQEGIYNPEGANIEPSHEPAPKAPVASSPAERIVLGKQIYSQTCYACHQPEGTGIPNAFPPLAKSDYLNKDVNNAIGIVLHGKTGELTVNGVKYNSVMSPQTLSDEEVANVLTFVYNSWGNNKTVVTPQMVEKVRKAK